MEITIGPYKILQRTEYSKLQVLDNNGNNMADTPTRKEIADKIISDYNYQTQHNNECFYGVGETLSDCNAKFDIKYMFVPHYIRTIAENAFSSSSMIYIALPESLIEIKRCAFKNSEFLEETILPNSVEKLGGGIFEGCFNLEKVTLPQKIQDIPRYMFGECVSLRDVIIPDSVRFIHTHAFKDCKNLQKINIPRNLEAFGGFVFAGSGVETLVFNHDVKKKNYPYDSYGDFLRNSYISKIEISKNVNYIDPNILKYGNISMKGKPLGVNIAEINYIGSEDNFKEFEKNNKAFLRTIKHAKINIINNTLDTLINTKEFNQKSSNAFEIER